MVHLRRALLLFAIVLGLAAIAASVSRPRENAGGRDTPAPGFPPPTQTERTPTVSPGNAGAGEPPVEVTFNHAERDPTRRVKPGQATTVVVEVDEPGQVEIPDLGLSTFGEPLTPARFEIFETEPGTYELLFTPSTGDEAGVIGNLTIQSEDR
jgi:hypothetical protein